MTLKIAKEFLGGPGASENDWDFVRAIVTLGHSLRLDVIAEGIECAEQLDRLRQIGVDAGQGFFFSPPVAPANLPESASRPGSAPASNGKGFKELCCRDKRSLAHCSGPDYLPLTRRADQAALTFGSLHAATRSGRDRPRTARPEPRSP